MTHLHEALRKVLDMLEEECPPLPRGEALIGTFRRGRIDLLNPMHADIRIEDIAEGLAHENRYASQTPAKLTVAEHSIHLARSFGDPELALFALLHDASEAYLRDIPGPVKQYLRDYQEIEHHLQDTIYDALCHRIPTKTERFWIKDRETAVQRAEHGSLLNPLTPCYAPTVAKQKFLAMYYELRGGVETRRAA